MQKDIEIVSSEDLKDIAIEGIQEFTKNENGINEWLKNSYDKIKKFNIIYKNAENEFIANNSILNQYYSKGIGKVDWTNSSYRSAISNLKSQAKNNNVSQKFLQILQKGDEMLQQFRQQLTGQTIKTTMTVLAEGKLMRIDEKNLNMRTVLSTYGASGNNLYSLAYQADFTTIKSEFNKIKNTNESQELQKIYDYLMKDLKPKYLIDKQKQIPKFDSTDAEILDYLEQTAKDKYLTLQSVKRRLTVQRYADYRKSFGRGKNSKDTTTRTQLGDVGLTQDKFISSRSSWQVNFARMTQVRETMVKLEKELKKYINGTQSKKALQKYLIDTFTGNSKDLDRVSSIINKEAISNIKQIFKIK